MAETLTLTRLGIGGKLKLTLQPTIGRRTGFVQFAQIAIRHKGVKQPRWRRHSTTRLILAFLVGRTSRQATSGVLLRAESVDCPDNRFRRSRAVGADDPYGDNAEATDPVVLARDELARGHRRRRRELCS
jgi:hypothetical protein